MTVTIQKGISQSERQKLILALQEKRRRKKLKAKKAILEQTFGSVKFDDTKTGLEIQKEMRDEWD